MKNIYTVNPDYTKGKKITSTLDDFYMGSIAKIYVDGKEVSRKVYDSKDGLYINFEGTRLFYEDFN